MKKIVYCMVLMFFGLSLTGCDSGDDNGGTSGGSGEITNEETSNSTSTSQPTSTYSNITLSAFSDFTCTSNWTTRDGALGLKAYSGSGICNTSFKGATGTYRVSVKIQTEFDGRPAYEVAINSNIIQSGMYPLSSPLGCDCPLDNWTVECPDRNVTIDCGTHTISRGDTISFKGSDDYPCGHEHGAYAKWHSMSFTPAK